MMTQKPLRTAIIGFGNVAAGYADDTFMSQYYPFATHAQVLKSHPCFDWVGVVDPSHDARQLAQTRWQIPHVYSSVHELAAKVDIDVAIIATPPNHRKNLLEVFTTLKGVLVEKPLALNLAEAWELIGYCEEKSLSVQVNFWRRGDEFFRRLTKDIFNLIGEIQAIFCIYGNGLLNNGSHLIDFVRFLCGEVHSVQGVGEPSFAEGPGGESNFSFNLISENKIANFQPVKFSEYREIFIDLWGIRGRLSIAQEGLKIFHYPFLPNRSTQGCYEIASDKPKKLKSTVGHAFYHMYTNLAEAINAGNALWSPLRSAYRNMQIIEALQESIHNNGKIITLPEIVPARAIKVDA